MSETSDVRRKSIEAMSAQVRGFIIGGKLYGEPINLDNIDEMIAAAYLTGMYHNSGFVNPAEKIGEAFSPTSD